MIKIILFNNDRFETDVLYFQNDMLFELHNLGSIKCDKLHTMCQRTTMVSNDKDNICIDNNSIIGCNVCSIKLKDINRYNIGYYYCIY